MIDLAYSAVLFDDKELAEEVLELEEKVEGLKILLLMNMGIVIRDGEDAEAMIGIIRIGSVAERISKCAGDIANVVLTGLGVDPFVMEAFSRTQERLVRTKINRESILVGKSLGKLGLESKIGVDIITIRRGKELDTKPKPSNILLEGDVVIARGSDVWVLELDKLAKGELREIPSPKLHVKEAHP